jgi:hypothetical protein
MYNEDLRNISIKTKEDFEKVFLKLYEPLKQYIETNSSYICLPNYVATTYSDKKQNIESFARVLWGLGPYLSQSDDEYTINMIGKKILLGVSPQSEFYWGRLEDFDQLSVEMPPIALFIYFTKDRFWDKLQDNDKKNIENWFKQINTSKLSKNNWLYFRVIVNTVLVKLGIGNRKEIETTFKEIEEFYVGNGWYTDGKTNQIDYYVSFAIHYYSLIYAKIMENDDANRSFDLKERAELFAKDFLYWFAEDGSALPFGRSLTYKFAQASFWSAYQFAGLDGIPSETVKGLIVRNIAWWFNQPIFDYSNLLTVGYSYPNLLMSEDYNGTGSSYWAFKVFLLLGIEQDSSFWKSDLLSMPKLDSKRYFKESKMTICRDAHNVMTFVNGQNSLNNFPNIESKYEKYVYSTLFGFSVPRSNITAQNYAQDSTLSVSKDGIEFKARSKALMVNNNDSYMYSVWVPWEGTEIETYILPGIPWHIRVHVIKTDKSIYLNDSGFCIEKSRLSDAKKYKDNGIFIRNGNGLSGAVSLLGNGSLELLEPSPNTNLLFPRTILPYIKFKINSGKYIIADAIYGAKDCKQHIEDILDNVSVSVLGKDRIAIKLNGEDFKLGLKGKYKVPVNLYKKTVKFKNNIKKVISKFES